MGTYCQRNGKKMQPMTEELISLNSQYNDIKINYFIYYDDIELKEKYISNYKTYVTELNFQLSDLNDKLNIAYSNPEDNNQNTNYINENINLLNNLDEINNKINEFHSLLEKQKSELKNLDNLYHNVQEQYNKIRKKINKGNDIKSISILNKINSIQEQLEENKGIQINLKDNEKEYNTKQKEIEDYLKNIQKITKEKFEEIKLKRKYIKSNNDNYFKSDTLFSNSSLLLEIKDFNTVKDKVKTIYSSKNKDKENNNDIIEMPTFLMKNWCEICSIYDDYDIHDITYKLKFIGLNKYFKAKSYFFDFPKLYLNSNSENHKNHFYQKDLIYIVENFEINGKKCDFQYSNNVIKFKIILENKESAKIHIKYKEYPKYDEKTEEDETIFNKISRAKLYGLSERLSGEDAKYILKNESNLEIINFSNEFLIKENNNEYQYHWRGIVPKEGKYTMIRMSKKEGIISLENIFKINTLDDSNIKQTIFEVPFTCIGGNNYLIKLLPYSDQTKEINIDKKKRVYNIKFINTNKNFVEFHIKAEFKNFYKDGWNIDLTNEEIDSLIPPDYKTNKKYFNETANDIIKQYDEEHEDDSIKVEDYVKIGKWVNKNIKYNDKYSRRNEITATETLNLKEGVCDHITKLFNALVYSLGYQVIYVNGYAMDKKNSFNEDDIHAWSLINIKGKWLPFDATYGIFSGKLPVTHVYQKIGNEGAYIIEELSDEKSIISSHSIKGKIY